ncbi:MAG: hypothetical protein QM490_03095 [Candidatus Gracilibacteria bacterium]
MFGHYIDDSTDLYLFKFEGINEESSNINLINYYGKPEDLFMRHFFSKVYGSTENISPFSNRLSEGYNSFHNRMDTFFNHYSGFIQSKYNLSFRRINLLVKKVDQNRNDLSDFELIGYYESEDKSYYSLHENSN